MQRLWAVVHGIERTSKRMAGALGVTGPQRLVVRVVGLIPGLSAGDLAAILHVDPSTLTGVLRRLVTQRYLQRLTDPRDGRRAVLRLTKRGARVNRAGGGTVEATVARVLRATTAAERAATAKVLGRLARELTPPTADPSGATSRHRRARARGSSQIRQR